MTGRLFTPPRRTSLLAEHLIEYVKHPAVRLRVLYGNANGVRSQRAAHEYDHDYHGLAGITARRYNR